MLYDLNHSVTRQSKLTVKGQTIFDMNFRALRSDQTKTLFEKFNLENLVNDIISNGDFNVFNVQTILTSDFDATMKNLFGKTLPEDIKTQFISQHVRYWSDLCCENSLNSIPDDIQLGKTLNWRYYQHPTIFSSDHYTDTSRNWTLLIKQQTLDDSSFFVGNFGNQTTNQMKFRYPELVKQFEISPYIKKKEAAVLAKQTGLTHSQIKMWFNNERGRNKIMTESIAITHPHLLESFEQNAFPSKTKVQQLAESTGLHQRSIQTWFRRERDRRRANGQSIVMPTFNKEFPELEAQFEIDPYSTKHHKELAQKTGLSKDQVQNWFQYKRTSARKNGIQIIKYPQLKEQFEKNPQLSESDVHHLMEVTGLSRHRIYDFFRHRQKSNNLEGPVFSEVKLTMAEAYPELGKQFEKNPRPRESDIHHLIKVTGLSRLQIYRWFRHQQKLNNLEGPVFSNAKVIMAETYPELQSQFETNPHPSQSDLHRLIEVTGLSRLQIYRWFRRQQKLNNLEGPVFSDKRSTCLATKFPQLEQQWKQNPNPTEAEKLQLMEVTGLTRTQITKHFYERRRKSKLHFQTLDDSSFVGHFGIQETNQMKFRYPELVKQFEISPYIKEEEIVALAKKTGLTHCQISIWFQNERRRNEIKTEQTIAEMHPQLLEYFERNAFPSKTKEQELAESTGLQQRTIHAWFHKERGRRRANGQTILRPSLSNEYPELEAQFEIDPYSTEQHKELAQKTGLSKNQVKSWFRRKRIYIEKNGIQVKRYPQLEEQFYKNPQPNESDIHNLIEVTGLSRRQIYKWFQYKQNLNNLEGPVFSDLGNSLTSKFPELEQQLKQNPNPTKAERLYLMETTGLTSKQISKYFYDRRQQNEL